MSVFLAASIFIPMLHLPRFEDVPLHSMMEILCAFAAIFFATVLVIHCDHGERPAHFYPVALGFLSMGILDGFHAVSNASESDFIWLHTLAVACGGFLSALVWAGWPKRLVAPMIAVAVAVLSVSIGMIFLIHTGMLPAFDAQGNFLKPLDFINVAAGILSLVTAAFFFRNAQEEENFLFFALFAILGWASLLFPLSRLWDAQWWLWHILRLFAYGLAIRHAFSRHVGMLSGMRREIEERKRAQEALRESEEKARVLFEMAPEAITVLDVDLDRFVDVNANAEKLFACSKEELLKHSPFDFLAQGQPDGLPVEESRKVNMMRALSGEQVIFERVFRNAAGRDVICEVRIIRLPSSNRRLIRASMTDISARIASAARIDRLTRLYRALSEINQAIVRMEDETSLFPLVCSIAVDFGGVNMAWIGRAEEGRIVPICRYGSGTEYLDGIHISTDPDLPEGRGPTAIAYRENRNVIAFDFRSDRMTRPWQERALSFGWGSSGTFPICRGSIPVAVLTVYHEVSGAFDSETVGLLDEMAKDISFALDSFDREEERRRAQAELLRSERHFRAYFERSMVGMAATGTEKGWIEVNDALCSMLGYQRDELVKMTWKELTSPEDLPENDALFERVMKGEIDEYEMDKGFLKKGGGIVHSHVAVRAIRKEDGSVDYMVALVEDVTERRKVEARERLRARTLELLAKGAPLQEIMDLVVHSVETENPDMLCTILLLDKEGRHLKTCSSPSLPDFYSRAIDGAEIGDGRGSCGTAAYRGERVIVEDIGTHPFWDDYRHLAQQANLASCWSEPIRASSGRVLGTFAIYQRTPGAPGASDIALIENIANLVGISLERKQFEEELQLASMVYSNSSEAIMVTDEENRIIAINPAFSAITGYSMHEVSGKEPSLLKSGRHDADFYRVMWREIETTGMWQGEVWNRRRNGEIFPEWLTINTIFNQDGSVHRHVALFSDITDKVRTDELIWKQANFDLLTDLPNRRMFYDRLEQEIKKSHRAGQLLALLFIDLDRFKEVNDTLGHEAGDVLLVEAADRIVSCVRESDMVARLGGDEFTVILSELQDASSVGKISQNILARLSEPFRLGPELAYVTASIGITFYPNDALDVQQLIRNADQAMYVAKNSGRNRFSHFTISMQEQAQQRLRILNDLRSAISAGQFRVHFQPIVDLSTGRVVKAEALLRWMHPERGMVSPMEFIPLAEETGLIHEIGDWVFRESARWMARWIERRDSFQVSVNGSPVQFLSEADFIGKWMEHLDTLGLSGRHFVVEITEGVLLDADSSVTDKLLRFRDSGISVAIDDFGTGYSSLSYLKKFDIDYLKIDRSFVRDLATDPSDMALSEAIIVMAHKLGLKVVAEGVETEQQKNLLAAAGCDYAQGYLFSKPLPPEEFETLLETENE